LDGNAGLSDAIPVGLRASGGGNVACNLLLKLLRACAGMGLWYKRVGQLERVAKGMLV